MPNHRNACGAFAPLTLKHVAILLAFVAAESVAAAPATILLEAESFRELGGWVIDQQFMDRMGSPFLLAHCAAPAVRPGWPGLRARRACIPLRASQDRRMRRLGGDAAWGFGPPRHATGSSMPGAHNGSEYFLVNLRKYLLKKS